MDLFPPEVVTKVGEDSSVKNGTYWVQCPYNKSHKVLNTRYIDHVEKCRRNYVISMRKNGEHSLTLCCQYNQSHKILAPELMYHEYACEDKQKGLIDSLFTVIYDDVMERTARGEDDAEDSEEDTEESMALENRVRSVFGIGLDELVECLHQKFIDSEKQAALEEEKGIEVLWADPAHHEHGIHPFKQFLKFDDQPLVTQRRRPLVRRTSKLTSNAEEGGREFPVKKKDIDYDDPEAWTSASDPTFCWLQSQQVHRPMSFRIPVGLTKAEKKKYQKMNAEVLKYEYGIFVETPKGPQEKAKLPKTIKMNLDVEEFWP